MIVKERGWSAGLVALFLALSQATLILCPAKRRAGRKELTPADCSDSALWRAVDHEGEVLEPYVTKHRDKQAALRFLKKLMKRHRRAEELVTNGLKFYGAALKEIGSQDRQVIGCWENNRVENSHQPFRRRKRAMLQFRRMRSLQTFAAVHSSVFNHFNSDRSLSSRNVYKRARAAALAERRQPCAA